jgi:adenylate cyclase
MRLLWAGTLRDRLRLWSGLVLFLFALTHFLNHALGIWSLEVMTHAQAWRVAVTRFPPVTVLLMTALLTHSGLALVKLARLRTFRLRRGELIQGLTGFAIPLLLLPHLFESGIGPRSLGIVAAYPTVLQVIWPASIVWHSTLLLVVWFHGCVGLHYWLRGEAWYRRASHVLAALAALVPAAALAGVVSAGREAAKLSQDSLGLGATGAFSPAARAVLSAEARHATVVSYVLVALALAIPVLTLWLFRRPSRLSIAYLDGPVVRSAAGPTLLEISRAHRVPHLSVCGGKARCSTCRVRILEGAETLEAPNEAEKRLLQRIGAMPDVRLACQIHPSAPLKVARLLKPETFIATPTQASEFEAAGVDRVAAILFIDIRGFTRLSQAKLAYDIVHILNSFFAGVGRSIEAADGRVDKYIGDGVMAVFEHPDGLKGAARAAMRAVVAIDRELTNINQQLVDEIAEPLRLAMGLHGGRLVMGRIGWGSAAQPTVIGPAVNVASRLESLAKAENVEFALSRECALAAGLATGGLAVQDVDIRGIDEPFPVVLVERVADLTLARVE